MSRFLHLLAPDCGWFASRSRVICALSTI